VTIVLAGGSGFLGAALRRALAAHGHAVVNLTRRPADGRQDVQWTPDGSAGPWRQVLESADGVINLAGEGIADRRWSDDRKRAILNSRILATRSLAAAINAATVPPRMLLNASGIGYYGPRADDIVTEATPPGRDFLATVCVAWEREAEQASTATRVALIRTGVVLHPDGGALAQMLTPFKLGVGGPIGTGRQYMPWIHRDDWVALVCWLIQHSDARGAFNGCATEPVTNAEFGRALGRALHRPAVLPLPAFALRILVGEMAELLLTGQRAIPARALDMGFEFRFTRLEDAFSDLFTRSSARRP
jgi:uncharacterized protein (TIGR01777 family)